MWSRKAKTRAQKATTKRIREDFCISPKGYTQSALKTLSLSQRTNILKPSPTLAITAKANALRAEGVDVISFGAGEPDFNTPKPICDAAKEALDSGFTKYTPSAGIKELREAICGKLSRENGLDYAPEQIIVSCGAKHSIYNAMQVLVDPGDEVILIAPYWMTYADQVQLAGGVPKVVYTSAESGFVPSIDQIKEAVSDRTKAILLNSPSNPTGGLLSDDILRGIAELAQKHDFWVIADEIYERLIYGETFRSFGTYGTQDRTITVGGCSKSYAMTGWRIGFAASPLPVAKAMSNFQDQVTSNPTSFAQRGAVVAFNLPAESVEEMRAEFEIRRNLIVGLLSEIPGVKIQPPKGAFYAFPDISACLLPGETDIQLAEYLLEKAHVAVVPGTVFEGAGHIRLSYATSRKNIEEGVRRIKDALSHRQ
ncbi:MAG: aminotransferase class I/II-fold pyridoxal phosphate-dependent enzyme [Armatimonadetes bacterium]|nr:aminotransferase class I/II-fold pyridoxal phosphate-dependent enzyme [Armatimonadota bacterium]